MKLIPITLVAAMAMSATAMSARTVAEYRTIPRPQSVVLTPGVSPFVIGADIVIDAPDSLASEARFMREFLPEGLSGHSSGRITLRADLVDINPEAYMITVEPDGVTVNGASAAGTYYGIQTLRKSMPQVLDRDGEVELPSVQIIDRPRFAYRGTHFDVSRHFFTIDEVKSFIDMVALHNVNTLHWHLTDDQGWRIEIKKYPRLTEVGSYRPNTIIGRTGPGFDNTPVSGFYTQDDAREIVRYAAERHIQVVPEIDLPGHMMAAMASYPELGCTGGPYEVWRQWGVNDGVLCPGKDGTMQFIADVLNEVMDIFPAPYIHIGGDECPKVVWAQCPHCQARIRELGLVEKNGVSAESQLQGYVTAFACDVVRRHGKSAIGWDEILECDIPRDAIIMSWRGVEGAAEGTSRGHRAILTPTSHCYFDFYQTKDTANEPYAIGGLTTVERVYSLEPCPDTMTPEQKSLVMGCQANLWTEYIPSFSHVQYMELPRLAALSEVQWASGKKDFEDFKTRIPAIMAIYDRMGYNYARHIADVDVRYDVDSERGALVMSCSALPGYDIRYTLDGTDPVASSMLYTSPVSLDRDCVIKTTTFKDGRQGRPVCDTLTVGALTFSKCTLAVEPDAGYAFGGAQSLVDGLSGTCNYRTGRWIGFSGKNCDATIELSKPRTLSEVSFNVDVFSCDGLVDCRGIEVYGRAPGCNEFRLLASEEYPEMDRKCEFEVVGHVVKFAPTEVSGLRVVIKPQWVLPEWHPLTGCLGFLFVDEISAR
ncbi:MAG: family 20 glycosylhydrolase [Muribaculaceae bacterium]|nr:family 20 glycosylhydrolase [Muribaculaceae bacterium]